MGSPGGNTLSCGAYFRPLQKFGDGRAPKGADLFARKVWLWVSIPFPMSDPYVEEPPWHIPWPGDPSTTLLASTRWTGPSSISSTVSVSARAFAAAPTTIHGEAATFQRRGELLLEVLPVPVRTPSQEATSVTDGDGEGDEDGDGDPEVLPVDANWYFFLFVCEHSILVPAPFAIPPWALLN